MRPCPACAKIASATIAVPPQCYRRACSTSSSVGWLTPCVVSLMRRSDEGPRRARRMHPLQAQSVHAPSGVPQARERFTNWARRSPAARRRRGRRLRCATGCSCKSAGGCAARARRASEPRRDRVAGSAPQTSVCGTRWPTLKKRNGFRRPQRRFSGAVLGHPPAHGARWPGPRPAAC